MGCGGVRCTAEFDAKRATARVRMKTTTIKSDVIGKMTRLSWRGG